MNDIIAIAIHNSNQGNKFEILKGIHCNIF